MSNNGAPDSWEQQADAAAGDSADSSDLSGKISTLNVNAAEFVPSFQHRQTEPILNTESPDSAYEQTPVTNGENVHYLLRMQLIVFVIDTGLRIKNSTSL